MNAKPQIPLAIVCSVLTLAFCTSGLAQSKPSADKPAAVTSQPPSTSAAPTSATPASPAPTTTASANATTPPKGTATVEFRNGLLHIIATDADLNSVLQQVSRVTGMRLQGGTHGDRLYGDYGPAIPADVLDHMLGGLPYNFIMTQAPRTTAPQQLVISSRHSATSGAATTAGANGSQTAPPLSAEPEPNQPEAEEQPEPGEPADTNVDVNFASPSTPAEPQPDNANNPPGAKTPEQFLEELKSLRESGRPPQ